MTPVPLELPLRPSEAAELANLIFDLAERKPLTDELRNRLAARAAALRLCSITPYLRSLVRDPVHPSAYYLAVDGDGGEPLLLYMALANAPTSSIYYRPLLIGRMRRPNGPEFVINATPFGPGDHQNLDKYVAQPDSGFLPRPQRSRGTLAIAGDPSAAFEFFRVYQKRTNRNPAALFHAGGSAIRETYYAGLWAAIRAGWRDEYTIGIEIRVERESLDSAKEAILDAAAFTRFAIDTTCLGEFSQRLKAWEHLHEYIRQTRSALKFTRGFDFELVLPSSSPEELQFCLQSLKERDHAPQLVSIPVAGPLPEFASIARQYQSILSLRNGESLSADVLRAIGKATVGRVNCNLRDVTSAESVAEELLG